MTLDEDLLESLYYRYSQRLENFARHILGDAAAARDVVQDSFIKLYRSYKGKDESDWMPLLFTVVRNSCKDILRKYAVRGKTVPVDISDLAGSEKLYSTVMQYSVGNDFLYNELVSEVNAILEKLPSRCREIFVMSRLRGMQNREIALALGISEQAVKNQISKALKVFRAGLTDWGVKDGGALSALVIFILLG